MVQCSESRKREVDGDISFVIPVKKVKNENESVEYVDKSCIEKLNSKFLLPILNKLKEGDPHGFFAYPVSDAFAPSYSQIISKPMDFSSMQSKICRNKYKNLNSFCNDFFLICTNAMIYNGEKTVYYKASKSLLLHGLKHIPTSERNKRKLNFRPQDHGSSFDEIEKFCDFKWDVDNELIDLNDLEIEQSEEYSNILTRMNSKSRENDMATSTIIPTARKSADETETPAFILESAKKAANAAQHKLRIYKPRCRMGFLRQNEDGSSSLQFVTPSPNGEDSDVREKPVITLGQHIGKLSQGSTTIITPKEDRRNVLKPVYPLHCRAKSDESGKAVESSVYGSFSSHAPLYDSTFSNLSAEQTALLNSTYGDAEHGTAYAKSILNFSRNCDYATFLVDHLLDILTDNQHSKTVKYLEEEKMLRAEDALLDEVLPTEGINEDCKGEREEKYYDGREAQSESRIDFASLKTLAEDGIDISFIDSIEQKFSTTNGVDDFLQESGVKIEKLAQIQHNRLSSTSNNNNKSSSNVSPGSISEDELNLANQVRDGLADFVVNKVIPPSHVVPDVAIKKLLGLPHSS